MASSASAASVPPKKRKSSNASSDVESETARLLTSLGSPGSSLGEFGTGVNTETTPPKQQGANLESSHVHFPAELPHLHDQHEEESSTKNAKASRNLPDRRLQPKKRKMTMDSFDLSLLDRRRKMSYESYDSAMGDSALGLASASMDNIIPKLPDAPSVTSRHSGGSSQVGQTEHAPQHGVSALEHLDALGDDAAELPAPTPVHEFKNPYEENDKKPKAKLKSDDGEMKPPTNKQRTHHAESLVHPEDHAGDGDDNTSNETFTSSGHRLLMEAFMMTSGGGGLDQGGRKRLESWGGMSDLSYGEGNTAAAIAASALQHTGIIADVTAAANFGNGSAESSVTDVDQMMKYGAFGRDRKGSTTSFSDSTFPIPGSSEGAEVSSDLQKFVTAAVASVGDQLAELAGAVENAAAGVDLDSYSSSKQLGRPRLGSETSSIASPAGIGIGAHDADGAEHNQNSAQSEHDAAKTVEAAATAAAISVDYDAVAAAVDAAQAATGALDLSAIGDNSFPTHYSSTESISSKTKERRKLPVHSKKRSREQMAGSTKPDRSVSAIHAMPPPKSTLTEAEQEAIRERARKAAGYVPPSEQTPQKSNLPPLKKRKKLTPEVSRTLPDKTPKASNVSRTAPDSVPSEIFSSSKSTPNAAYSSNNGVSSSKSAIKGQSTQKWESMFQSLLEFIEERKKEELEGATQEEIDEWEWDGNVPTTYKTKDGKALGRWINNQRSAKSKGTLKDERAKRLVDAGLKWSVLASNSWNEMLDELRDYVKEYTKDGKTWDGNVPTNYRIKAKPNGKKLTEEDKNLGRWVNRQRSLKQAGKLRKDRQLALEKVGLKWSMLATTSWDSMFETLVEYVEKKKKEEGKWDGNVPANYRTDDDPPRALGRWINRQRSAHVKKKLKPECVEKLTKLGLKWSVHERRYLDDLRDYQNSESLKPDGVVSSSANSSSIPTTIAVPAKITDKASGKGAHPEICTENDPDRKVQVDDKGSMSNEKGGVNESEKLFNPQGDVVDKDANTESSSEVARQSEAVITKNEKATTPEATDSGQDSPQKITLSAREENSEIAQSIDDASNNSEANADNTSLTGPKTEEQPHEQEAETSQETSSSSEGLVKQNGAVKSSTKENPDSVGRQQIISSPKEKATEQGRIGNSDISATDKPFNIGVNSITVDVPKENLAAHLEAERTVQTPRTSNESHAKVASKVEGVSRTSFTAAEVLPQEAPNHSASDATSSQVDVSNVRNSQLSQNTCVSGAATDGEVEKSTKSTSGNAELSQNGVKLPFKPSSIDTGSAESDQSKLNSSEQLELKQYELSAQSSTESEVVVISNEAQVGASKTLISATPSKASNLNSTIGEVSQIKKDLGRVRSDADIEDSKSIEGNDSSNSVISTNKTTKETPKETPSVADPSGNCSFPSSSQADQQEQEQGPQSMAELTNKDQGLSVKQNSETAGIDDSPPDSAVPQNREKAASSPPELGVAKSSSGQEKKGNEESADKVSQETPTSELQNVNLKPTSEATLDKTASNGSEDEQSNKGGAQSDMLATPEGTKAHSSQVDVSKGTQSLVAGHSTSAVEGAAIQETDGRVDVGADNPCVAPPRLSVEKAVSKSEKLKKEKPDFFQSDGLRHVSGSTERGSEIKSGVEKSDPDGASNETPQESGNDVAEIEAPRNRATEEAEDDASEKQSSARAQSSALETEATSDPTTPEKKQRTNVPISSESKQSETSCTDNAPDEQELLESKGKARARKGSEGSAGKSTSPRKTSSSLKKLQIDMNIDMSVSRRSRNTRGTDRDTVAKNGDNTETPANPGERRKPQRNSPRKAQRAS